MQEIDKILGKSFPWCSARIMTGMTFLHISREQIKMRIHMSAFWKEELVSYLKTLQTFAFSYLYFSQIFLPLVKSAKFSETFFTKWRHWKLQVIAVFYYFPTKVPYSFIITSLFTMQENTAECIFKKCDNLESAISYWSTPKSIEIDVVGIIRPDLHFLKAA